MISNLHSLFSLSISSHFPFKFTTFSPLQHWILGFPHLGCKPFFNCYTLKLLKFCILGFSFSSLPTSNWSKSLNFSHLGVIKFCTLERPISLLVCFVFTPPPPQNVGFEHCFNCYTEFRSYPQAIEVKASIFLIWVSLNFAPWRYSYPFGVIIMMHAKTDSDATSYAPSSPRSPKRQPVYYVQSPSRDSHDDGGDKSSTTHATPACNSPMESPSHQSYGHHSRASSASRISGAYNNNNNNASSLGGRKGNNRKRNEKGWPECKVIEEEGGYGGFYGGGSKGLSRRTQVFIAVVGFVFIFSVFCLIIWGASLHYKPQLSVKVYSP